MVYSSINILSNLEAQSLIQALARDMAPRATAESQEQGSGGNTLPAYENSEEESRNTSSEVPHKNIGPRVDSDMAPPDSEASNRSKTLDLQTTQDGLVSRRIL